jgi:glycosyltransferase involved in cell wall biosynthesis
MTRCVRGRVPLPGPLGWAAIPYMQADLFQKRSALKRAGAVLAVSEAVAIELRAAGLDRVEVIPNVVNPVEVGALAAPPPSFPLPERFLLFVGKLEENKGARALVPAVAASRTGLPLVVLGEGSMAHVLKFDAAAASVPLVMRGWAHRDDVLRSMARATAIVFPSLWPEPLSRVLLEALALGTPVAAMATGGTREILVDGESGLIVTEAAALGDAVARLVNDDTLRSRIAEGARERGRAFAPETLVPRYEAVYRRLA